MHVMMLISLFVYIDIYVHINLFTYMYIYLKRMAICPDS